MNNEPKQRQKGYPIGFKVTIPLVSEKSYVYDEPNKIDLEITASEEDWYKLYCLTAGAPQYLGDVLFLKAAQPVYKKFLERLNYPPARGIHAVWSGIETEEEFMRSVRIYAAAAHTIASYWLKKPKEDWPEHFVGDSRASAKHNLYDLILNLLIDNFDKRRRALGLEKFDTKDESDFFKMFLRAKYQEQARSLFEKNNFELSINDLAYFMT